MYGKCLQNRRHCERINFMVGSELDPKLIASQVGAQRKMGFGYEKIV
jgi:hypothetical protein